MKRPLTIAGTFTVWRPGASEASGFSVDLAGAKRMLREGRVGGEVRDPRGNVVATFEPKQPLAERIAAARVDVDDATRAVRNAEYQRTLACTELEQLLRVAAAREASPVASQSGPLFAPKRAG